MVTDSRHVACFEHSIFLKVNEPIPGATKLMVARFAAGCGRSASSSHQWRPAAPPPQKSNYELFNCNNFNIRYWSWNSRGCWHPTCPPIDPRTGFYFKSHCNLANQFGRESLLLVTTSLSQDWVIYAPAAFRRSGSRFSGSLSGIEP